MTYIPHTEQDVKAMLKVIGVDALDALFDEIPNTLKQCNASHTKVKNTSDFESGLNEMQLRRHAEELAAKNTKNMCFVGAGSYEHHIPAAVWAIASRGEFLTAYTPYQAEASQGTLQLLYEFQSMIATLTGLDVANASLYDGASALAEAILMAVRIKKKHPIHRILIPESIHPHYREVLNTFITPHDDIEIITLPLDKSTGITQHDFMQFAAPEHATALIIPQVNFLGCIEAFDEMTAWAHNHNIITIACFNPIALGLLKPPGEWGNHGTDIACGEGQPLGIPMSGGGPYLGLLSTKMAHVRALPGRLVGQTQDEKNRTGYTLTLQAREQHIRRAKATSNICTNQGLLVTAATIYMALMGAQGLAAVALSCHQNTTQLVNNLCTIKGVKRLMQAPFFHEACIQLPMDSAHVIQHMQTHGIDPGLDLASYFPNVPEFKNTLLMCATECRVSDDLKQYERALRQVLMEHKNVYA